MRLILLAAPGAGKGTQAEILSEHFQIPTISTGAMLRKNMQEQTELGKIAKQYIDDGKFIPDDVIIEVVKARLSEPDCKNGFILDGFPRTIPQAEALTESGIPVDIVLNLKVSDETIIERLVGRRECKNCGATYHTEHNKPQKDGVCDKCGGELVQRKDDKLETIRTRLDTYHEQTEPLISYYEEKNLLRIAMSKDTIAETTEEVLRVLGEGA